MVKEKFYIAYGSNLNKDQMKIRCPRAEVVGTGVIKGYELVYRRGFLTLDEKKDSIVHVGIWKITTRDEFYLDIYEGYPSFYDKKDVYVKMDDGASIKALVYIMREGFKKLGPREDYRKTCMKGYKDFGMDVEQLRRAEKDL